MLTGRDLGMRYVGSESKARSGHSSLLDPEFGRGRDHVDTAIVGMTPRSDIPVSEELGVHRCDHLTAPPRPPRDQMCDKDRVSLLIGDHPNEIDRQVWNRLPTGEPGPVTRTAERSHQVATEQADRWNRRASVATIADDVAKLGVGRNHDDLVGWWPQFAPVLTLADGHRTSPRKLHRQHQQRRMDWADRARLRSKRTRHLGTGLEMLARRCVWLPDWGQ